MSTAHGHYVLGERLDEGHESVKASDGHASVALPAVGLANNLNSEALGVVSTSITVKHVATTVTLPSTAPDQPTLRTSGHLPAPAVSLRHISLWQARR